MILLDYAGRITREYRIIVPVISGAVLGGAAGVAITSEFNEVCGA